MLLRCYNNACVEAGLDEAGRGCLAGPVVASAVILPPHYENELLNDSKQLTKEERNLLRKEIEEVAVAWAVASATNGEIDRINILQASFLAMHRAVDAVLPVCRPEHLLIDGNRFTPYPMIPHTCVVKGDSKYMAIAAASILAKTHRDEIMENLALEYPHYRWEQNAGYPTIFHRKAIQEHGYTPYHRLTFRVRV
ncbi:MAG: ribonuclease HII [Leadbetterella sp.]|nr:ribonuclease HII [Leadbetterella sp.]